MTARIATARTVTFLAVILAVISLWWAAAPVALRIFGQADVLASSLAAPVEADQPAAGPTGAVDLAPVLDFAPFGRAQGMAAALTAEDGQSGFVLLGITVAEPQSRSRAIIAGGTVAVANYGIGDEITQGVTVAGVFADHVVISLAGQEQDLHFLREAADLANEAVALGAQNLTASVALLDNAPLVAPSDATNTATRSANSGDTALGRYRAEAQQDPTGLALRLGLDAGPKGYLVTPDAAEIILQAGLQPGDLLVSVNGTALGDPVRDAALFDKVAAAGRASVSVLRAGTTLLMTFPLP